MRIGYEYADTARPLAVVLLDQGEEIRLMFRAYGELRPTPDGVFSWSEGDDMPFKRGRRGGRRDESNTSRKPKLPMFSELTEGSGYNGPFIGVKVNYRQDEPYSEGWPLARDDRSDRENPKYESDPQASHHVMQGNNGPVLRMNRPIFQGGHYEEAEFPTSEDAENAAWKAYQHDVDWMGTMETVFSRGEVVDDDRYITDNTDFTRIANDKMPEEDVEDEYLNMNGVWHRLDE